MRLDICWRRVSKFGRRVIERCGGCGGQITRVNNGTKHQEFQSMPVMTMSVNTSCRPHGPKYQPLQVKQPCLVEQHYILTQDVNTINASQVDPFSAQLNICREQSWWNPPIDVPSHTPAREETTQPTKRSLSIRDIRERMNSERSVASSKSGEVEWEPGLKFLEGVRGAWKDMEVFVD
jgi:hypothetical protein